VSPSRSPRALLLLAACGVLAASRLTSPGPSPASARFLRKADASREARAGEPELTPFDAAAQDYANRAYPGVVVPFKAAVEARGAFHRAKGRGVGAGKNVPGQWTLLGPTTAKMPSLLTFSGADYTTSGRVTALAIAPACSPRSCRVWLGAAGGGVWRTDDALSGAPRWTFVSGSFATNAIGVLTYDAAHGVLYAGTGEPNTSGDSEAGLGVYASTDGGTTWRHLPSLVTHLDTTSCGISDATGACTTPVPNGDYTGDAFANRAISAVVADPSDPNVLWVGTARGVRGVSEVLVGGATSNAALPRPPYGLFKSTDGGATFAYVWDGNASVRGVNHAELDPRDHTRVYAAAFQQGVWRSTGGGDFEQVFAANTFRLNNDRTEFALTTFKGHTRIYVGDGEIGFFNPSTFWRVDDADVPAASLTSGNVNAGWTLLTSVHESDPGVTSIQYCGGQCAYDNVVVTPAGHPDVVYLGGSYQYGEYGRISNGRAVLLSTDAGVHFTDMTWDASSPTAPNGLHPDQHALVVHPGDPFTFFSGSDGGIVRSSGAFADVSSQCGGARKLTGDDLDVCRRLLSRVPTHLFSLNKGLSTLQLQSVSVNPTDPKNLIGGTQDNGTFQTSGSAVVWQQVMYGDGGNSGFDATGRAMVNTFTGASHDANFRGGDPTKWVVIGAPIKRSLESVLFYPPILTDPLAPGTIFTGAASVWRTRDFGGDPNVLEASCPEFTTLSTQDGCGDFVRIGPSGSTSLIPSRATDYRGTSRAGGNVGALARSRTDTKTLWAGTTAGRLFVSKNADAPAETDVTWVRIDTLSADSPGRFPSRIVVDLRDANHAWISYSGYAFNTPSQPGHVYEVTYDPKGPSATFTDLSFDLGDLPVTSLAFDDVTHDLYAATDFGVLRLARGATSWALGGAGLPEVEVPSLTLVPSARVLYAATHGRGAWMLKLP
jgi:hypothetical protein